MADPFRILALNNISPRGLDRLPRSNYEVASGIERPDAVLLRSADMHKMTLPESVLAVAQAGAGTNNIPVAALAARGIPVFNTPGANANAVKELVMAGLFMAARNIGPAWLFARAQSGDDAAIDRSAVEGRRLAAREDWFGVSWPRKEGRVPAVALGTDGGCGSRQRVVRDGTAARDGCGAWHSRSVCWSMVCGNKSRVVVAGGDGRQRDRAVSVVQGWNDGAGAGACGCGEIFRR